MLSVKHFAKDYADLLMLGLLFVPFKVNRLRMVMTQVKRYKDAKNTWKASVENVKK